MNLPLSKEYKPINELDTGALLSLIRGYLDDPGRTAVEKELMSRITDVLSDRYPDGSHAFILAKLTARIWADDIEEAVDWLEHLEGML